VLARQGDKLLSYGHPAGQLSLRRALAQFLFEKRGLKFGTDEIAVTRGSQMALALTARTLLAAGETVAVETLGYRPAWDALRAQGATLRAVPVDEKGMRVSSLEQMAQRHRIRAVYLTPHHQYPTTAPLALERRLHLIDLARKHRFVILEDDYDYEFQFEGRPTPPLATRAPENVVYLGTLSKVLAPGLRQGFVVGPASFIERLVGFRALWDRQGDAPMEAAIAEYLEEGEFARHLRKMRTEYWKRRDALCELILKHLHPWVSCDKPTGGIALWVHFQADLDVDSLLQRCQTQGIHWHLGEHYHFSGRPLKSSRWCFTRHTVAELTRAISVIQREIEKQ
jgi:GntR family transcriptional regulator / MocR family aminotransferase